MTRRRDIETHRRSLEEIRDIMNSMKNLAYMESRKISGFLHAQHDVVSEMELAAEDFFSFHPHALDEVNDAQLDVYVLIGAERGFCGDFNHTLLRYFESRPETQHRNELQLIAVGHKLHGLLQGDDRQLHFIDGASVVEEVENVLNQLVKQLADIQQQYVLLNLFVIYHDDDNKLISRKILPPFQHCLHKPQQYTHAPLLNLPAEEFILELSYQYLFAILYEILYTSLMAECRRRVAHLEVAVHHMQEQAEQLRYQSNVLRQEEIIEEIEVILLSASSTDDR